MPSQSDEEKTERDWYNLLTEQTPESAKIKAELDHNYSVIDGYIKKAGGMHTYIALCGEHMLQGESAEGFFENLNDMHPRALLLLAKYGHPFRSLSHDFEAEPGPGACFANAVIQMRVHNYMQRKQKALGRMLYVEGVAFGGGGRAIHHAWNTSTEVDHMAMDWTWYALAGWSFYFGISLTQRQHAVLRSLAYPNGKLHLLFLRDVFPRIEQALTAMLERRHSQTLRALTKQLIRPDRDF
jgi:hypothetical protein